MTFVCAVAPDALVLNVAVVAELAPQKQIAWLPAATAVAGLIARLAPDGAWFT
jgi:hypothetical protein